MSNSRGYPGLNFQYICMTELDYIVEPRFQSCHFESNPSKAFCLIFFKSWNIKEATTNSYSLLKIAIK